jgi:hypothetical protein
LFLITLASPGSLNISEAGEGVITTPGTDDKRMPYCFSNDDSRALLLAVLLKDSHNSPLKHAHIFNVKKYFSQENA